MSRRTKLTRRQFLYLSTLATAGAVASACAPLTPEVTAPTEVAPEPTSAPTSEPEEPAATEEPEEATEPTAEPEPVSMYKEAPMLAALVESGALPPVEERLPLNPRSTGFRYCPR